jgi:hypothetical protein
MRRIPGATQRRVLLDRLPSWFDRFLLLEATTRLISASKVTRKVGGDVVTGSL